jgi:hypothetical protein
MQKSPLLLAILAALPACNSTFDDTGCVYVAEDATSCEPAAVVDPDELFLPDRCGDYEITEVKSDGTLATLVGQ